MIRGKHRTSVFTERKESISIDRAANQVDSPAKACLDQRPDRARSKPIEARRSKNLNTAENTNLIGFPYTGRDMYLYYLKLPDAHVLRNERTS